MKKMVFSFVLLALTLVAPALSHASYLFKNGKLIKTEEVATLSVQEHYAAAAAAYQSQNWEELIHQSLIVLKNFSATPFALESYYYLGAGYFHQEEFEYANRFLTSYLKKQATPKYFAETIEYKFRIAEKYRLGAKKHMFGWESFPKWLPAREDAVAIYDEVITALPHHELAAYALFGKAQLLLRDEEYKQSIETYQTLIRRFPKHPLAAEGYVGVIEVYLVQSQRSYPDQDFLDLAEIALRKFKQDFPGEEKVALGEEFLSKIQDVFASDLYDTARFYERTKKSHAAYIYYTRILAKYSQTHAAQSAKKRLERLDKKNQEETLSPSSDSQPTPTPTEAPSPLLQLQPSHNWTVQTEESEQHQPEQHQEER